MLPESPPVVKPKAVVMSKEKLARKLAKFHRKQKYNANTCKQNLEVKKLKTALEARKEHTIVYSIVKIQKPILKQSIKKQAEKQIIYFPEPEKETKIINKPKINPNYYWSACDTHAVLIMPSQIFDKFKREFENLD